MRTSIPVCRKPQVSPPPPQNRSTASIPSYLTFLLVAFLAISNKHIQSNTRLPHVQPDGHVRLENDYLVLPLLHRLVCCSRGLFWIAHSIPFSGGVGDGNFRAAGGSAGRLAPPREATGVSLPRKAATSAASPGGRGATALPARSVRRFHRNRPTGWPQGGTPIS